jgi:hypothetical protein
MQKVAQAREPSRLGSYLSSILPLGSTIYGAAKGGPGHRFHGASAGLGGDTLGTLGGAATGIGAGGLLGLLALIASRGKLHAQGLTAMPLIGGGMAAGGLGGGIVGGGEGTYQALKHNNTPKMASLQKRAIDPKVIIEAFKRLASMAGRGAKGFGKGVVHQGKVLGNVFTGNAAPGLENLMSEVKPLGRAGTAGAITGAGFTNAAPVLGGMGLQAIGPHGHKNAYDQGFIDKCAELGVDPKQLLR